MKFLKLGVSAVVVLIFSACSDSNVTSVKNGIMKNFSQSLTVGQAIDSWSTKTQKCDTTKWEAFESERGEKIVSFKCSMEKEASLSAVGLNTQSILQSNGIKDVNAVYSKLEEEIGGYENQKKQLLEKIQQEKQVISDLNLKLSEDKEEEKLLRVELDKIKAEEDQNRKLFEVIYNQYKDPALLPKDPEEKNKAIETFKNAYKQRDEIQKSLNIKRDEIQTKISKTSTGIFRDQEIQGRERSLDYMKKNAEEKIASINSSIEKGKKDVQKIEMTSDALEQLKKVNLIIQFTLSADGKSFVPSYEGVEYSFKDSKMYAQDIATSTQAIMMGVEVLKRFGGFGGTGGLLTSAYLDNAYKVGFHPEFYEQRK